MGGQAFYESEIQESHGQLDTGTHTLQLMIPRWLDYSHVYTGETHSSIIETNTLEAASTTLRFPGIPYSVEEPEEEPHCYDSIKTD